MQKLNHVIGQSPTLMRLLQWSTLQSQAQAKTRLLKVSVKMYTYLIYVCVQYFAHLCAVSVDMKTKKVFVIFKLFASSEDDLAALTNSLNQLGPENVINTLIVIFKIIFSIIFTLSSAK